MGFLDDGTLLVYATLEDADFRSIGHEVRFLDPVTLERRREPVRAKEPVLDVTPDGLWPSSTT